MRVSVVLHVYYLSSLTEHYPSLKQIDKFRADSSVLSPRWVDKQFDLEICHPSYTMSVTIDAGDKIQARLHDEVTNSLLGLLWYS